MTPLTRSRLSRWVQHGVVWVLVAAAVVACGDEVGRATRPTGRSVSKDVATAIGVADSDSLVLTPAGWYNKSCVYKIPNGSRVHGDTISPPAAAQYVLPPCLHAHFAAPRRVSGAPVPSDSGWVIDAEEDLTGSNSFRAISATWVVPGNPGGHYSSNNEVYFAFPGITNSVGILQPVLSYGYGEYNHWQMSVWFCGSNCPAPNFYDVSPGDTLDGTITTSNCSGGNCAFTVQMRDRATGDSTRAIWTTSDNGHAAYASALETYTLPDCTYYPWQPLTYTNISASDRSGVITTPWWTRVYGPNNTPSCSFDLAYTNTTVTTREHALGGVINGDLSVNTGISCHYSVSPFGGYGGYGSYLWSVDGTIDDGQGTTDVDVTFNSDGSHLVSAQFQDSQGNVYTAGTYVTSQTSTELTCAYT